MPTSKLSTNNDMAKVKTKKYKYLKKNSRKNGKKNVNTAITISS